MSGHAAAPQTLEAARLQAAAGKVAAMVCNGVRPQPHTRAVKTDNTAGEEDACSEGLGHRRFHVGQVMSTGLSSARQQHTRSDSVASGGLRGGGGSWIVLVALYPAYSACWDA